MDGDHADHQRTTAQRRALERIPHNSRQSAIRRTLDPHQPARCVHHQRELVEGSVNPEETTMLFRFFTLAIGTCLLTACLCGQSSAPAGAGKSNSAAPVV